MTGAVARCVLEDYQPEVKASPDRVNRYWDTLRGRRSAKLKPGEFYVSESNEQLVSVVGSGVALCLRDHARKLVGMSRFLLPDTGHSTIDVTTTHLAEKYAVFAIRRLLERLYERGASPASLEAVIVGGACIWPQLSKQSQATVGFTRHMLGLEGIPLVAEFIGSAFPRKVHLNLEDAVPLVEVLTSYTPTVRDREEAYLACLRRQWLLGFRRTSLKLDPRNLARRRTHRLRRVC